MEQSHTAENVVPVIYGGSMKPDNVAELVTQRDIHGGLIGGASLKPEVFLELILKGVRAFS
jgi:triosephosphate isomerase